MNDVLTQFRDAIRNAGMEPPDVINPGEIIRFAGTGKRPSNRAGWCLLFEDGQGGCFGDWSTGTTNIWHAKNDKHYSKAQRQAYEKQYTAAKQQHKAVQDALRVFASERARDIWSAGTQETSNHPYVSKKNIKPHGAKMFNQLLILPVINMNNQITSLQFINEDGTKKLLKDGQKKGCFIPVTGSIHDCENIVICEGWATGCTLAEEVPNATVIAAIDAGNLEPVAMKIRHRYPGVTLVIAGDDDRQTPGNPGATKAWAAAIAADALLALPHWPDDAPEHLTDFNDLALWQKGDTDEQ